MKASIEVQTEHEWIDSTVEETCKGCLGKRGIRIGEHRVLVGEPGSKVKSTYNPLEVDALHRKFTKLSANEDSIKLFAEQYGTLGLDILNNPDSFEDLTCMCDFSFGETITEWLDEIQAMRYAIELWDAVNPPRIKGKPTMPDYHYLREHILWIRENDNAIVAYCYSPEFYRPTTIKEAEDSPEVSVILRRNQLCYFIENDRVKPAMLLIQRWVNARLIRFSAHQLQWDSKRTKLIISSTVRSLLGALWLQFAQEIANPASRKMIAVCSVCGQIYSCRRNSSRYCGTACKKRAQREREKATSHI